MPMLDVYVARGLPREMLHPRGEVEGGRRGALRCFRRKATTNSFSGFRFDRLENRNVVHRLLRPAAVTGILPHDGRRINPSWSRPGWRCHDAGVIAPRCSATPRPRVDYSRSPRCLPKRRGDFGKAAHCPPLPTLLPVRLNWHAIAIAGTRRKSATR